MDWTWILSFLLYIPLSVIGVAGKQGFGPGEQDWGYVTVRKNAHMFWWLYYVNPPVKPKNFDFSQRPLLIWLQGGPGASSTSIGNFKEFGPLDVNLQRRNHTWVNDYNVLFIDNPIGSGFSYAKSWKGYVKTSSKNAQDLFVCIKAVLDKIKGFEKVPTYILGQSYGGKMAVKFARLWHTRQKYGFIKSNLKGIALGNAWISPIDSVRCWAPYLLEMGIIDTIGFENIKSNVEKILRAINNKKWSNAKKFMDATINIIHEITDNVDVYNILSERLSANCSRNGIIEGLRLFNNATENNDQLEYLINTHVTSTLGLPNRNWTVFSRHVYNLYTHDFMKPVTNTVEYLLNETDLQIIIYNGQLDMIVPIYGTLTWVENLKWKHSPEWFNSERISFNVNSIIQGYVKSYKNLKMYWVSRAGHMVPKDNPYAVLAILQAMTEAN